MQARKEENKCGNCGGGLPPSASFCPACGQKNTDGRFTFRELLENVAENVFSLDARIFQTLGALAVPGKLTENFFQGKHIRYYHPVRLFFFSAAILIAAITLSVPKGEITQADDEWGKRKAIFAQKELFESLDSMTQEVRLNTTDTADLHTLDSLSARLSAPFQLGGPDSIPLGQIINLGPGHPTTGTLMSMEDVMTLTPDSLCIKYGIDGLLDRAKVTQGVRVLHQPSSFLFYLIGNTIWMMLIMMPLLALVLRGIYFRRPFLYYEHLIFSFHIHTFLFLTATLFLLIQAAFGGDIAAFGIPLTLIYPLLAQKRFYKQAWWKTIFKSMIVSVLYIVLLSVSFLLVTIASVFFF